MPKKLDPAGILTQLINKKSTSLPLPQVTKLTPPAFPQMSQALLERIVKR